MSYRWCIRNLDCQNRRRKSKYLLNIQETERKKNMKFVIFSFVSLSFRSLTRGDLDINVGVVFVGVLLTIGDVRRGVNAIGVRGVAIELTVDGVC